MALRVFPALPAEQAEPERFAAYCRRLYKRLARHGFERSFQLHEGPGRQDKLTTWIEYLGFVIGLQLKNEKIKSATLSVESAEKTMLKAQSTGLSRRSQIEQRLSAARSKLAKATKPLELTSRRCEIIVQFSTIGQSNAKSTSTMQTGKVYCYNGYCGRSPWLNSS